MKAATLLALILAFFVGAKVLAQDAPKSRVNIQENIASSEEFVDLSRVGGDSDDFYEAISIVFHRMARSYREGVKNSFRVDVLNINDPEVYQFVSSTKLMSPSHHDSHVVLGVNFIGGAVVDGERVGSCIVHYNSKERMRLLNGYEKSGLFSKQEILYYLAAHEFGHCMAFHQISIGASENVSASMHELIADRVTIAFFLANGNEAAAKKIIQFNQRLDKKSIHYHGDKLSNFYHASLFAIEEKKEHNANLNMYDIYRIAKDVIPADVERPIRPIGFDGMFMPGA